jgi:hypothetical protein
MNVSTSPEYEAPLSTHILRIVLLVLIIIGIVLLFTQSHWVPQVVHVLLRYFPKK